MVFVVMVCVVTGRSSAHGKGFHRHADGAAWGEPNCKAEQVQLSQMALSQ
jgi:hypothetical protein